MKWNDYKDLTVQLQVSPTAKIIHSGVHPGNPQLLAINGASMPVSSAAAAGAITNHLTQTWQQKRVSIKTLEGEFSVTMWASAADDEGKLRIPGGSCAPKLKFSKISSQISIDVPKPS